MTGPAAFENCPYVGLQPFREEHREYFFGREKDQRIIIANVLAARLTVLYGASGVGKSSVLMAGVVPQLRRDRPRIPVVVFRDWVGEDVGRKLARACIEAFRVGAEALPGLREDMPLDELLHAGSQATRQTVLVILDQFEEYFLYHGKSVGPDSFEAQLARAVNREDIDAGFLISLREDSLSKLDRFRERIPNLLNNRLCLKHLDVEGAEQAIRRPLEVWNSKAAPGVAPVSMDDDLVSALIDQVRAGRVSVGRQGAGAQARSEEERVEAPFLQLVLARLWSQEMAEHSPRLRQATFEQLGGAQEIVHRHLCDVMEQLGGTGQAVCATFFDRLVTPSGGKFACSLTDLSEWAGELQDQVKPVLDTLSGQRILRTTASAQDQSQDTYYEIYHDVLAPAIVDWRTGFLEQREREAAGLKAQQEQEAASLKARQEHRRRRQQRLLVAVSMFVLFTVTGWLYSFYQQTQAQANAQAARVAAIVQTDALRALDEAVSAADQTRRLWLPITAGAEDALRQAVPAAGYEPRTLDAGDWVWGVAFSPTGRAVAAATRGDKVLVSAQLATGAPAAASALVFDSDVRRVIFLGDGQRLLAVEGKAVHLRDLAHPEVDLATYEQGSLIYGAVAVSPGGAWLATAGRGGDKGQDRVIKVWDLRATGTDPQPVAVIDLNGAWAMGLAFSPDGCCLATATVDKGLGQRTHTEVWGIASRKRLLSLPNRKDSDAVRFTPDGKSLVVACRDNRIRVYTPASGELDEMLVADARTGQERAGVPWDVDLLAGHTDRVRDIAVSQDGTRIASASGDRTVRIWDRTTGEGQLVLKGHRGWVESVAFSPDGRQVVSGGRDRLVKVWDVSRHTAPLHGVAFSADGTRLATASADGTAKIWDVSGDLPVLRSTLVGHQGEIYRVAFAPGGKVVATASFDNNVRLWDAATGAALAPAYTHLDQLRAVAFSPDGAWLATASADGHARLFKLGDAGTEPVRVPRARASKFSQMRAVAFHPQDHTLLTASAEGELRRWSLAGEPQGAIELAGVRFTDMALSPDGSQVVALGSGSLYLWGYDDLTRSKADSHTSIALPDVFCYSLTYSPDGRQLAVACEDAAVRLYDMPSGQLAKTMTLHNAAVSQVAFSADGQRMATASADRTFSVLPVAADELYKLAVRLRKPQRREPVASSDY
jgi:WD40 repeat protein